MVPNVSVVVAVWNDAARLPRAVASVLRQSLRDVEVVIVDDGSADRTPLVAERLCAGDRRVRYVRLPVNSGGCSVPRNAGIDASHAPFVMFLDSDDELLPGACKTLLGVVQAHELDFAAAMVERYFEDSGRTAYWYPALFERFRIVDDVRAVPEMLFDVLATNKMYRRKFIDGAGLRFPERVHFEDQVLTARAYCLASRFAVVPWPVYRWRYAGAGTSISSSRDCLDSISHRVAANGLVDEFLARSGYQDLRPAKDFRFLRHDMRLYLGDLRLREVEWVRQFIDRSVRCLGGIGEEVYARLSQSERICLELLREGRAGEAIEASWELVFPNLPPRAVAWQGAVSYWGPGVPADQRARSHMRVAGVGRGGPFERARLRHEAQQVRVEGTVLALVISTYDPGRSLTKPRYQGSVLLAGPGRFGCEVPVELVATPDGCYRASARIDLARVRARQRASRAEASAVLMLSDGTRCHTSPLYLLNPGEQTARVRWRRDAVITSAATGALSLAWRRPARTGFIRRLAARLRRLARTLTSHGAKERGYRWLIRLVPVNRRLALFEAGEGRGYAGSPRYIYEELIARGIDIKVVWSRAPAAPPFPAGLTTVHRGSWRHVWTMARARYWVDTHNLPSMWAKRRANRYLQTWHGQPLKVIGFDSPQLRSGTAASREEFAAQVSRWDMLIAPSNEFSRTFVPAVRYSAKLLRTGTPCNDPLVRHDEPEQLARARRARDQLSVPAGRQVLLYAPTYRDDGSRGIRIDLDKLAAGVAGQWIVVLRPHPYTPFEMPPDPAGVFRDGRPFPDVNDLPLAADLLVTDYSSIMIDYANTGRPMLFFTDDYPHYRDVLRGTYYDLAETVPGPLLTRTEDLVGALSDLDAVVSRYASRYDAFRAMFCAGETGHASAAVVDAFFAAARQ
jgi:CDP-glycerol glycerophosphotransferase